MDPLTRKTTCISARAAGRACGGLETPGDKLLTPITFLPHTKNTENLEQNLDPEETWKYSAGYFADRETEASKGGRKNVNMC